MTVLELCDTAIKIGLGALISAVATHLNTKRTHSHDREQEERKRVHEREKEARKQKAELIERVVKHVDDFNRPFNDYMCSCPVAGDIDSNDASLQSLRAQLNTNFTPEDMVACKSKAQIARSASTDLTAAMSLLNLLGPSKALDSLFSLRNSSERFWLAAVGAKNGLDPKAFLELRGEIAKAKKDFYETVRDLYPVK